MIKIFQTSQIKELDALTIRQEGISSYDLMKRAVGVLFEAIMPSLIRNQKIIVLAGPGNNGGDALVLCKSLLLIGCDVKTYLFDFKGKLSDDCQTALNELKTIDSADVCVCNSFSGDLDIPQNSLIIDGLFGSGLSRPLEGDFKKLVEYVNRQSQTVYSIDIPSGLSGEKSAKKESDVIICATKTFTFQQVKMSFLLPENEKYLGDIQVLNIGLSAQAIAQLQTNYYQIEKSDICLKKRIKFGHKGTFGHALLIAGKYGMAGASILASRACLKSGCGLVTVHVPKLLNNILQIANPEAILDLDDCDTEFSEFNSLNINKYSSVGVGPGLGTSEKSLIALKGLLESCSNPMVLDADALNLISKDLDNLLPLIPQNSIITPHPKEFDRLCGASIDTADRIQKQIKLSQERHIVIVLKGAYTSISTPDGNVYFNSTGNNGMATAGSGDVLTGIILSLLSQGNNATQAAIGGVYLHGLAGDIALCEESEESLLAGDIINHLGKAFKTLKA